ncbi:MAG: peroxiredoxin [Chloroflexi bacterium]|nr:peroxiredoxin [Chloroflexota bacterium]
MSGPLASGSALPEVEFDGPDGRTTLDAIREGRPLVVAFYTEDRTPLCTAQLCAFRDDFELIDELGAAFVGVSADGAASQASFREEQGFPFPLLADEELALARAFGVVDEAAKRSVRAIFVTDASGSIVEAIPYYNPSNGQQYQAVFAALGMDLS